jgi:hypothetical protein
LNSYAVQAAGAPLPRTAPAACLGLSTLDAFRRRGATLFIYEQTNKYIMIMKYFGPDKDWEYNSRTSATGDDKWLKYKEGYKKTSEFIEEQILDVDRTNQDFLLFPYCYCIRHYIEISLKEIIDEGSKLIGEPVDPTVSGHSLCIAMNESLEILSKLKANGIPIPQNVQKFICELHLIDVKSDNFRYPIDRKGNKTLKNIKEINFKKVADGFKEVKLYLDGMTTFITTVKDNMSSL